jgi:hypothetical protein
MDFISKDGEQTLFTKKVVHMNIERLGELKFNDLQKETGKLSGSAVKKAGREKPVTTDEYQKSAAKAPPSEDTAQVAAFARNQPDVRVDKIAEVKQKLAEHFYEMEKVHDDIADKIARYLIP